MEFRLGELCSITSSKRIYRNEYKLKGIPFYRGKEIIQKSNNSPITDKLYISTEKYNEIKRKYGVPQKGDILITAVGTIGISYLVKNEKFYFKDGNLIWIKDFDKKIDNEYLFIYLNSLKFKYELEKIAIGSTQSAITIKELKKIRIDVPSIQTQKKIVEIYKALDKKIKLNNQINNNLYKLGDELYKEYYLRFINNLPEGYEIKCLNEVAQNFDSKRKPMSSREREIHHGVYPYYGATSIIDYVDDYIFDDTYVLMGEDGTVKNEKGNPVLQYIWGKNWVNNHAHVLKGIKISTEHLYFALRNVNVESLITGAVQQKLSQENMNKIKIIIGNDKINSGFEKISGSIMQKSKLLIEENKTLGQLRDALLPKLMNGEIDLDKIRC